MLNNPTTIRHDGDPDLITIAIAIFAKLPEPIRDKCNTRKDLWLTMIISAAVTQVRIIAL